MVLCFLIYIKCFEKKSNYDFTGTRESRLGESRSNGIIMNKDFEHQFGFFDRLTFFARYSKGV